MKQYLLFVMLAFTYMLHAQDVTIKPVKMEELVALKNASPKTLVINFWSTWCKPCLEEIPYFICTANAYNSDEVELWLVSLDTKQVFESRLKEFVEKRGWKARFFWLSETNADVYCPMIDDNWSGVLPATLIANKTNGFKYFQEEAMTAEALRKQVDTAQKNDRHVASHLLFIIAIFSTQGAVMRLMLQPTLREVFTLTSLPLLISSMANLRCWRCTAPASAGLSSMAPW